MRGWARGMRERTPFEVVVQIFAPFSQGPQVHFPAYSPFGPRVIHMNWEDVFKLLTAALLSVGGGGAIVIAVSSWLGKRWAERILTSHTHRLATELERTKRELDGVMQTTLRFQNDKLVIYRGVIDTVARLLSALDAHESGRLVGPDAVLRFDEFNEQRLKVYGYLAMLAPQAVMDAQDDLIDYLLEIANGGVEYDWTMVRAKALNMLNAIRDDIGIDKSPIQYNGRL